jgi:hypothetical protein
MERHFDVVGYDIEGQPITEGDIMGELEGDVMGDLDGDELVGAARKKMIRAFARGRAGGRPAPRQMALPPKPGWRSDQMAPGVIRPDEVMYPLPLTPNNGTGTFTVGGAAQITWAGQLQKPFRGERLLVGVDKKAGATERLMAKIWVGTDLQAAEIADIDLELIGDPGAFGTRMTFKPAEPGVQLRVEVWPSAALTGSESIFATIVILGRVVA